MKMSEAHSTLSCTEQESHQQSKQMLISMAYSINHSREKTFAIRSPAEKIAIILYVIITCSSTTDGLVHEVQTVGISGIRTLRFGVRSIGVFW